MITRRSSDSRDLLRFAHYWEKWLNHGIGFMVVKVKLSTEEWWRKRKRDLGRKGCKRSSLVTKLSTWCSYQVGLFVFPHKLIIFTPSVEPVLNPTRSFLVRW